DFKACPIVELRRSRTLVRRGGLGVLDCAAVLEVDREAGCAKGVARVVVVKSSCLRSFGRSSEERRCGSSRDRSTRASVLSRYGRGETSSLLEDQPPRGRRQRTPPRRGERGRRAAFRPSHGASTTNAPLCVVVLAAHANHS